MVKVVVIVEIEIGITGISNKVSIFLKHLWYVQRLGYLSELLLHMKVQI